MEIKQREGSMEITACPQCGSRNIRVGTLGDGIISGMSSWKEVCQECGYQGSSLLFDTEETYQKFLQALKNHPQKTERIQPDQEEKPVTVQKKTDYRFYLKLLASGFLTPLFLIAVIFLSAGRLDYWQGWGYTIVNTLFVILTIGFLADRPEFIKERMKPGQGMKSWDKLYFMISTPMFFLTIIIAGVNVGRGFGSIPFFPSYVYLGGYLVFIAGQWLFLWSKRTNRFFSSVVRIQTERGHQVCQTGPYRVIRHPGYLAGILFTVATPFILGSLWALIPALIAAISLIIRTYLEDTTLQKELLGYSEYTKKTRYRLMPHVW